MNFTDKREPNRRPPTGAIRAGTSAPTHVPIRALLAVALAAALLGLAVPPALAQSASASPDASPEASAPSESTNQVQQEQTVQSDGEDSQDADAPEGETSGARGLSVGGIHIDENCVQNGPITIGNCKANKGDQGERPGNDAGGQGGNPEEEGQPESTTPESTTPQDPEDGSSEEPGQPGQRPSDPSEEADSCATVGPIEKTREATIAKVTDGDTAELDEPIKGTTTVRFIGVDTPETVDPEEEPEPYGKEASTFTEKALEGEQVALELDADAKDDYDRLLAYVWASDADGEAYLFNEALLEHGYGQLMIVEPNAAYEACLSAAEGRAKEAGAGLWGLEDPPTPDPADPPETEPVENPDPTGGTPTETPEQAPETEDPASPEASTEPSDTGEETAPEAETPETTRSPSPESSASPAASPAADPAAQPEEETTGEPAAEPAGDPPTSAFGSPQGAPETPVAAQPPGDLALGDPQPVTPSFGAVPETAPAADQYAADPGAGAEPEIVLPDSGGRDLSAIEAGPLGSASRAVGLTAVSLGAGLIGLAVVREVRKRMAG